MGPSQEEPLDVRVGQQVFLAGAREVRAVQQDAALARLEQAVLGLEAQVVQDREALVPGHHVVKFDAGL
jgi:hypothetical protein